LRGTPPEGQRNRGKTLEIMIVPLLLRFITKNALTGHAVHATRPIATLTEPEVYKDMLMRWKNSDF